VVVLVLLGMIAGNSGRSNEEKRRIEESVA
jgi:hypothetical protein